DYTSLLAKTYITFKPVDKLKIIPSYQGVFDLHQNQEKTQTTNELCCKRRIIIKEGAFLLNNNRYLCFDESREPVAGRQNREA
ncbi:hypothetical protein LCGC14_2440800, partial [marine sediment metagenome]